MSRYGWLLLLFLASSCKVEPTTLSIPMGKVSIQRLVPHKVIGALEWVRMEKENIQIKARIDTGAQTSSLHATNIKAKLKDGKRYVSFDVHDDSGKTISVAYPVARTAYVRNTSGIPSERFVIEMKITLGTEKPITAEVNLHDRSGMSYKMLLGRNVLTGRYFVDVGQKFLLKDKAFLVSEVVD